MIDFHTSTYLHLRRTKVIATVGPASSSYETLKELILAGVNLFRLNFSHGTHADHLAVIERIRQLRTEMEPRVAILGDLSGPKIRVGMFAGGEIPLTVGETVEIVTDQVEGRPGLIPSQYHNLLLDIEAGQRILLDDGRLEIKIKTIHSERSATAVVVRGGVLKNKKGMNIPDCHLSVPALTEKDFTDLRFCIEQDLEYVALSFVRTAGEILDLKTKISRLATEIHGYPTGRDNPTSPTRVIAKIEKPEALAEITEIINASDGIMIARGDLGVEMPAQQVPIIQAQLITLANQHKKPVIVATQMLETMIDESRPTRAEVSDVANAVLSSADAVMLSGETAVGRYPVESVAMMDAILRETEAYQWKEGKFGSLEMDMQIYPVSNAIARACTMLAKDLEIRAVNVITWRGGTAKILSSARPNAPILAYSRDEKSVNQLLLHWGVFPILHSRREEAKKKKMGITRFTDLVNSTVKAMGIAEQDQFVLIVSNLIGTEHKEKEKKINSILLVQVP